jgi:broad specificity polyphosphatase/5'/3'-nucleotidase SurE
MTGEFYSLEGDDTLADHNLVAKNYISIVPHKIDTTDYDELKRLEKLWQFKI